MFLVELVHKSLNLCESLRTKATEKFKKSKAAYYMNIDNLRNLPQVRKTMCKLGRHKFESTDPEDSIMTCRNCSMKRKGI